MRYRFKKILTEDAMEHLAYFIDLKRSRKEKLHGEKHKLLRFQNKNLIEQLEQEIQDIEERILKFGIEKVI